MKERFIQWKNVYTSDNKLLANIIQSSNQIDLEMDADPVRVCASTIFSRQKTT